MSGRGWRSSGSGGSSPDRPTRRRFWANVERGVAATRRGPARPVAPRSGRRLRPPGRPARPRLLDARAGSSRASGSTPRGWTSTPRCSTGSTRCSTWPSTPAGPPGATRRRTEGRPVAGRRRLRQHRPADRVGLGRRPRRRWAGRSRSGWGSRPDAGATFEPLNTRVAGLPGGPAGAGPGAGGRGVYAGRRLRLVALRPEAGGRRADLGPGRRDADRRALAARPALHPDGLLAAPGPLALGHGLAVRRDGRRPGGRRGGGDVRPQAAGRRGPPGGHDLRRDRRDRAVQRRRRRPARPPLRGAAPGDARGLRPGRLGPARRRPDRVPRDRARPSATRSSSPASGRSGATRAGSRAGA